MVYGFVVTGVLKKSPLTLFRIYFAGEIIVINFVSIYLSLFVTVKIHAVAHRKFAVAFKVEFLYFQCVGIKFRYRVAIVGIKSIVYGVKCASSG